MIFQLWNVFQSKTFLYLYIITKKLQASRQDFLILKDT